MSEKFITERINLVRLPKIGECCNGGVLEMKNGELCLRLSDTIGADASGLVLTRTWRRPGGVPFDPDFYAKLAQCESREQQDQKTTDHGTTGKNF